MRNKFFEFFIICLISHENSFADKVMRGRIIVFNNNNRNEMLVNINEADFINSSDDELDPEDSNHRAENEENSNDDETRIEIPNDDNIDFTELRRAFLLKKKYQLTPELIAQKIERIKTMEENRTSRLNIIENYLNLEQDQDKSMTRMEHFDEELDLIHSIEMDEKQEIRKIIFESEKKHDFFKNCQDAKDGPCWNQLVGIFYSLKNKIYEAIEKINQFQECFFPKSDAKEWELFEKISEAHSIKEKRERSMESIKKIEKDRQDLLNYIIENRKEIEEKRNLDKILEKIISLECCEKNIMKELDFEIKRDHMISRNLQENNDNSLSE